MRIRGLDGLRWVVSVGMSRRVASFSSSVSSVFCHSDRVFSVLSVSFFEVSR